MSVYQDLVERKTKLSLIGLGYVGMPIAVEFAKHIEVVGFDVNEEKIRLYRKGVDPTKEVGDEAISSTGVDFTSNPERLREARFHIVAVPTPIDQDKTPDLSPLLGRRPCLAVTLNGVRSWFSNLPSILGSRRTYAFLSLRGNPDCGAALISKWVTVLSESTPGTKSIP